MKRDQRLRRSADFAHVRASAPRSWANRLVVLYAAPNDQLTTRVGFVAGRRVGNAVVRNRARRRLREVARLLHADLRPGYDLVLIARPAIVDASWDELRGAVESVVRRAGLRADAPALAAP